MLIKKLSVIRQRLTALLSLPESGQVFREHSSSSIVSEHSVIPSVLTTSTVFCLRLRPPPHVTEHGLHTAGCVGVQGEVEEMEEEVEVEEEELVVGVEEEEE